MAELRTEDAVLHVEVDGEGTPVIVVAHGLTNSCRELAMLTPFIPGTKVRFCFRGHGHSSAPETGYRFDDFTRDLMAVADGYGAEMAIGTSLGAAAIMHELARSPDRFRKLVFVLPTGLDSPFPYKERFLRKADLVERLPRDRAVEVILDDPSRQEIYERTPWLREYDRHMLEDLNPVGVARAIREIVDDVPLESREQLRRVTVPTLVISREGDQIHPAWVGRELVEVMPNAELVMLTEEGAPYSSMLDTVSRVREFLLS